jgi:hypothetical protein
MMLRPGLLADVSVSGDAQGTFGVRGMRNAPLRIVSAQDAQGRPQDHIDPPPMRTSVAGRKI